MEVIRWSGDPNHLQVLGWSSKQAISGWFYGGWRRCNSRSWEGSQLISEFWDGTQKKHLLPRNLTWNLKMMVSKRNFLFWGLLFRFHDKFRGCKTKSLLATEKKTQNPKKTNSSPFATLFQRLLLVSGRVLRRWRFRSLESTWRNSHVLVYHDPLRSSPLSCAI